MFNIETLRSKSDEELAKLSKDLGVKLTKKSTPEETVFAILDYQASNPKVIKDYLNANNENMNNTPDETPKEDSPAPKKRGRKPAEKSAEKKEEKPADLENSETEKPVKEEKANEDAKPENPAKKKQRARISQEKTEDNNYIK